MVTYFCAAQSPPKLTKPLQATSTPLYWIDQMTYPSVNDSTRSIIGRIDGNLIRRPIAVQFDFAARVVNGINLRLR